MAGTQKNSGSDLAGRRILVTSGPTRGRIDAVRFIGNKSTGKLGTEIALEAMARGATVTFVYGKDSLTPRFPVGAGAEGGTGAAGAEGVAEAESRLRKLEIETVEDLAATVTRELQTGSYDAVIHAMAVLDFAPDEYRDEKTKSDREEWVIRLVRTPKVIAMMKDLDPAVFLVGFKLEFNRTVPELLGIGLDSLRRNRADLVVVNDLTTVEKGEHAAYFVHPNGSSEGPFVGKGAIASGLLDRVEAGLRELHDGAGA